MGVVQIAGAHRHQVGVGAQVPAVTSGGSSDSISVRPSRTGATLYLCSPVVHSPLWSCLSPWLSWCQPSRRHRPRAAPRLPPHRPPVLCGRRRLSVSPGRWPGRERLSEGRPRPPRRRCSRRSRWRGPRRAGPGRSWSRPPPRRRRRPSPRLSGRRTRRCRQRRKPRCRHHQHRPQPPQPPQQRPHRPHLRSFRPSRWRTRGSSGGPTRRWR